MYTLLFTTYASLIGVIMLGQSSWLSLKTVQRADVLHKVL
ncbi:putative tail protein [Salmonella phage 41]|nr:putative tail protein [Salmonella phage 41]